jgi:hypothetical protein
MVEIGVREGGSTALMALAGRPSKLVAIELADHAPALTDLIEARDLPVRTYFGVDQGDRQRLTEILDNEFDGPIDLVVDDASHLYRPTLASFETIFPRLRPGHGVYVIEDWRWQYRLTSGLIRRLNDPTDSAFATGGLVGQTMMEAFLLKAVRDDPTSEVARSILDAEAAGELTPRQQALLTEARGEPSPTPDAPASSDRTSTLRDGLTLEAGDRPLATLAAELMLALACASGAVSGVQINEHWLVVERGPEPLPDQWRLADSYDDHFAMLA